MTAHFHKCAQGLYCDGSVCQIQKADGSDCDDYTECLSENCVYASEGYTCQSLLANGAACDYDSDCQSYNCVNDVCQSEGSDQGSTEYDLCDGNDVDPPLMSFAVDDQPL